MKWEEQRKEPGNITFLGLFWSSFHHPKEIFLTFQF